MSKKIIILSIAAFFVVVGGAVGTLWLINNNPWAASETKVDPAVVVPDLAEDYGACNMLTKDQIASALGSAADNLGDAYNSGRIFSQGGSKSQFCRFSLGSDAETNNFKAEVMIFAEQSFADTSASAMADDSTMTKVQLSAGDGFFYEKQDELLKTSRFVLTFIKGLSQYTFTITQPTSATTFNATSAETPLTTLANEAKLS